MTGQIALLTVGVTYLRPVRETSSRVISPVMKSMLEGSGTILYQFEVYLRDAGREP